MNQQVQIPESQNTLPQTPARAVSQYPDKTWIKTSTTSSTFAEADRGATRYANGLKRLGVDCGEVVLVMMLDTIDHLRAWLYQLVTKYVSEGADYPGIFRIIFGNLSVRRSYVACKPLNQLVTRGGALSGIHAVLPHN